MEDKHWTGSDDWSECSVTCGQGQQSKKNKCVQTSPLNSHGCNGRSMTRICSRGSCEGKGT